MSIQISKLTDPSGTPATGGTNAAFSPDKKYVMYTAANSPFGRMYRRDTDVLTPLANFATGQPSATCSYPFWTFDGKSINLMWLSGSNYQHLYNNLNNDTFPLLNDLNGVQTRISRWSPDNNLIWTCQQATTWFRMWTTSGANHQLGTQVTINWNGNPPTSSVTDAAISPDMKKLAIATGIGGSAIQIYDILALNIGAATMSVSRRAPDATAPPNGQFIRSLEWHPNSIHLAATLDTASAGQAGLHIYRVPISIGAAWTRLATLTGASATERCNAAKWSSKGNVIGAFASNIRYFPFDATTETVGTVVMPNVAPPTTLQDVDITSDETYIVAVSSTSPTLTFFKVRDTNAVTVHGTLPVITGHALLDQKPSVRAHGVLSPILGKSTINQYTIEYPAALPFRLVAPDLYFAPPTPLWSQSELVGAIIGDDYGKYNAAMTTEMTYSATISGDYGKYDANLFEHFIAFIDSDYGKYNATLSVEELTAQVTIVSDYGKYETDLTEIVVPDMNIDAVYGNYDASLFGGPRNDISIDNTYGSYDAELMSSAIANILSTYGTYDAALAVDVDVGVSIVSSYGQYTATLLGSAEISANIDNTYGKYQAVISAQVSGGNIKSTYGKYQADISALLGNFIDVNNSYGKYTASLSATVSGKGRITFMLIQP